MQKWRGSMSEDQCLKMKEKEIRDKNAFNKFADLGMDDTTENFFRLFFAAMSSKQSSLSSSSSSSTSSSNSQTLDLEHFWNRLTQQAINAAFAEIDVPHIKQELVAELAAADAHGPVEIIDGNTPNLSEIQKKNGSSILGRKKLQI